MSLFSRADLVEASIWSPKFPCAFDFEVEDHVGFALDLLNHGANPNPIYFDLLPLFETSAATYDLIHFPPHSAVRRLQKRAERAEAELNLRSLSDRVAELEVGFGRALAPKVAEFDRKYKWTAEIKGEKMDRKYKWTAEAKAGEEKSYTWTAEIKGKGKNEGKAYMFEASAGKGKTVNKEKKEEKKKEEKKEENKKDKESGVKLVEIEERNPRAIAIKKAFFANYQNKGKKKELSPQDAAIIIQMTFRAHLVRRSQVVRCLRDLAVAKAKLKEIRAKFYNFTYRRHITNDAEERQRFSERIIVLLLSVDAIEVGFSGNIPCWLESLFKAEFFDLCLTHIELKQNEKNIFCLDCCHSFCSNCSPRHFGHRVLQIRKYNDHRVVKTEDMEKLINCSSVQSYMLNRAQVVFLKARSPNRKKEKAQNEAQSDKKRGRSLKQNFPNCDKICSSCPRTLKEEFDYCSINCMVKQVLKTEGSIVVHLRRFPPLPLNPMEADEELVPADLVLRDPATTGSMISGTRRADCLKGKKKNNEAPSPCALVPMHRRKGVPKRSPFC